MWQMITVVLCCLVVITTLVIVSYKRGKEAEKNRALLEEIERRAKEQQYANEKVDTIRNMSDADVRNRLHELANKYKDCVR